MSSGVRATVRVRAPAGCPIARFAATTGTAIEQVSTSAAHPDAGATVTEFLADTDEASVDSCNPVFSYGGTTLYRTAHDGDTCPCTCLGRFGCPVHRYEVRDGDLTLVFHTEDFEQLQAVMAAFRERFAAVDVRRLLQPPLEGTPEERVFVNRGRLTDRQLEVLQAAYDGGYFERPRRVNATELAAELEITQSTFTEHLVAAQRKLLEDVL